MHVSLSETLRGIAYLIGRMFLLHVNFERLLVLVVPVALWTLKRLCAVASQHLCRRHRACHRIEVVVGHSCRNQFAEDSEYHISDYLHL